MGDQYVYSLKTFEMYKNDISTPGGGSRMRRRRKSDKGPLKVFLLPMTHVDPGWLETFDSYVGDTNRILDNMFAFLKTHPRMRFMWCEMVFFERWWSGLNNTQKAVVKQFVASGQLEMASGSWVMTDEANPFFPVTIDNIVEGQQFIFHQLGAKARTIWSNDPFGYGSSVPYLFTKTGVKWAVINRIHHRLKNFLQNFRAVPFKWRQYFDVEGDSDVYTHVLPYAHYDILNSCGPTPSVCCEFDFKRLTHHMCPQKKPVIVTQKNVADRAALLEEQLNKLSDLYQSNVVLVMWGDDFRYNSIEEWHQQYDNLAPIFDHINAANRTQIRFGTFVDYFTSLEKSNQEESSYPFTLSGDFFPYQCALGDLWTGYYTTRPFYKKQERQLHALIRAADLTTASVVKRLSEPERKWIFDNLSAARRNLSLFQHHDAITGTSKKHVMSNYAQLLFDSMKKSAACIAKAISTSHEVDFEINEMPLQYNQITSKKPIVIEPGNTVSVAVYNSVERKRLETIVLVVSTYKVSVMQEGKLVKAQIEPFVDSVTGRLSSLFSLVFHAMLPPLSTKIFTIVSDEQHSETDIAEVLFVADIQKDAKSVKTRSMGSMKFVQTIDQYVSSGGGPYIMHQTGPSQTFNLSGLSRFVIRGQMQQTLCIHSERLLQRTVVRNVPGMFSQWFHRVPFTFFSLFYLVICKSVLNG
ncbi:unnamed protein product [Toxocara canis]|uniref:mannosyl-oligosaccharide 1,3-1,6-alpha-mannosidase n=1 Tax=Toxocara canis TaxID=6265 RepID=A0A183UB64_TOXCA|nr:unnamed protein product [Toxocara canis]